MHVLELRWPSTFCLPAGIRAYNVSLSDVEILRPRQGVSHESDYVFFLVSQGGALAAGRCQVTLAVHVSGQGSMPYRSRALLGNANLGPLRMEKYPQDRMSSQPRPPLSEPRCSPRNS